MTVSSTTNPSLNGEEVDAVRRSIDAKIVGNAGRFRTKVDRRITACRTKGVLPSLKEGPGKKLLDNEPGLILGFIDVQVKRPEEFHKRRGASSLNLGTKPQVVDLTNDKKGNRSSQWKRYKTAAELSRWQIDTSL